MQNMDLRKYAETEDALFHYTRTSIAIEHILYRKEFKLSILNDTNDPREYKFKIFNSHRSCVAQDVLDNKQYEHLLKDAHSNINKILRFQCRVMCFCSNAKSTLILSDGNTKKDNYSCSQGWEKSRMWSQYGDNHRGICLVISKDELKQIFDKEQAKVKIYSANYVKYFLSKNDYSPWPSFDGSSLGNKSVEECSLEYVINNFDALFFSKHIDYRDEAEFRVVVLDPQRQFEYIDIDTSLRGVIVGDRTPDVYFPLIKEMCKKLNIQSQQAYWSTSSPHMILRDCKSPDII